MFALPRMFVIDQCLQLFQIRQCPEVEFTMRVSEFIMSDRPYFRRILNLSPVGNCPRISPPGTSAPTRVETDGAPSPSQVK
jgi:hypothetical protein